MGRLGAYQDRKVIKLAAPPDRRVVTHIERALRPAAPSGPPTAPETPAEPAAAAPAAAVAR